MCSWLIWDGGTIPQYRRYRSTPTASTNRRVSVFMNFSVRSPIQYVHFRIVPVLKPYLLCTIFPPRRRFGRHRSHNIWFIDHHLHLPAKIYTQPTVWAFLKIYSHAQLGQPTGFFSMSTAVFIWPQIVIYLSKKWKLGEEIYLFQEGVKLSNLTQRMVWDFGFPTSRY